MEKRVKNKRSVFKMQHFVYLTAVLILCLGIWGFEAKASDNGSQGVTNNPNNNNSTAMETLTVWNIIQMNDWFLWPFIALTGYGLMINIHRILVEHREKSRSEALLKGKIHAKNIRNLVQMARGSRPNRASRLFYQMIATFEKTNQAESINEEINQFVVTENTAFERFSRVNGFLSETSGALGLLGTVWGIFVTFYSAKLDGPTILRGMSIALVTTLTGLIISLALNSGGTYLYTLFNRQLNAIASKAEELRQALLYLQKKSNGGIQPLKENLSNFRVAEPEYHPKRPNRAKEAIEIAY